MSMRDYGISEYGLLLDDEALQYMASKICKNYSDDAYKDDKWDFIDEIYSTCCEYLSNFTGETFEIDDVGDDIVGSKNNEIFYETTILYVPCNKFPKLFSTAYQSVDEIVDEMRERVGKYLPSDFDYRGNIRHIVGTYFG